MKKNYQKPEIIEEIEIDRKIVYAVTGGDDFPSKYEPESESN